MKKFSFCFTASKWITAVFLTFIVFSCQKELLSIKKPPIFNTNDNASMASSCIGTESPCLTSILCSLADTANAENERMNMIMYHYGVAVKNLVQDEDFRCFMVDAIFAAQPDNGATFKDLAKNSSTFKTALNAELRQSIIDNSVYPKSEAGISLLYANTAWDANSYLYERFVYDSVQYEPSIYFIGEPSSCELTDTIGVVIGEEVTCCDDAPGWLNGVETLFSEYYSINSPNINIFIGPNEIPEEESLMNPGNHIVQNDKVNQRKTIVDIDVDEWKIKNGYRYESSCESEIRAQVIMYNVLANWDILGQKFDGFPKKVSSINVGTSTNFTTDVDAYGMDVDRYDSGYRAFTYAYEYDWYVYNYKVIKNPIVDALYLNGKGRMKYSNEWYFRDNQILKYMLPSVNSTAIIENDKCRFKMKRSL